MDLNNGGNSGDWFLVAMAEWKMQRKEKAYNWYDRAVEWMAQNSPRNAELTRIHAEAVKTIALPFERLLETARNYPTLRQGMFGIERKRNRWVEAAAIGNRLIEGASDDDMVWLRQAPVMVLAENHARYSSFCTRMVEQFKAIRDPSRAERVCKACLLQPGAIEIAQLPHEVLARSLDNDTAPPWLKPWGGPHALWSLIGAVTPQRQGTTFAKRTHSAPQPRRRPWACRFSRLLTLRWGTRIKPKPRSTKHLIF